MADEWLRVADVVKRYGVSRNTPRNWHKAGVRMRHGRYSARDIEHLLARKSAGRTPGKKAQSDLSPREKELSAPFVQREQGLRKLKRLLWTLPVHARHLDWSATKKERYATALREAADAISPATLANKVPAGIGLLQQRDSQRQRLTRASGKRITKSGIAVSELAKPKIDGECEIIPWMTWRTKQDEQYVLLDARDFNEFAKRAKERGYEFLLENSDPRIVTEGVVYDENSKPCAVFIPDLAAEIDDQNETEGVSKPNILAQYRAITDPVKKECFLHENRRAIWQARMERAKPVTFDLLSEILRRLSSKHWKCIKTDDGYAFRLTAIRKKKRSR